MTTLRSSIKGRGLLVVSLGKPKAAGHTPRAEAGMDALVQLYQS